MSQSEPSAAGPDLAFLLTAFETNTDGVAKLASDGTVLVINGAGAYALGCLAPEDIYGRNWLDFWPSSDREVAASALRSAAAGTPASFRDWTTTVDGSELYWDTTVISLPRDQFLVVSRDITKQRDGEQALDRSHRLQQAIIRATSEIMWHVDVPTGITTRRGYFAFTGQSDDPGNDGWLELVHPEDRQQAKDLADEAEHTGRSVTIEYRLLHKGGLWRWVEDRATALTNHMGEVTDWVGIVSDTHDRKSTQEALRKNMEHLRLAVEATGLGTWDVDMQTDTREWSPEMFDLLKQSRTVEPSRKVFLDSVHPDDRNRVDRELKGSAEGSGTAQVSVFRLKFPSGEERWIEAHERTFFDEEGRPHRRVGTMQDISERKRFEHEIWLAAHTDALTGIANRAFFQQRLDKAVADASANGGQVGLLIADLDRFKDINDTLGHDAGDALLRAVADRLRGSVSPDATVARLGGDEFGMIVPLKSDEVDLEELATSLITAISAPVDHAGRKMECAVSIGWSICPSQADTSSSLLKNADIALYAAKSSGRNRAAMFTASMKAELERRLNVLLLARDALARNAVVPFYQPKLCLRTGNIVGFEALLRWTEGARLRPPAALQEALDDPALSVRLGSRMLDLVTADMRDWIAGHVPFVQIALNAAAAEFQPGLLADRVIDLLSHGEIAPEQLEIEVTERVLLDGSTGVIGTALERLRNAGVSIALDDFGTGYASLTHLTKFPVSWLKIDRSFTSDLGTNKKSGAVVDAITSLAHKLGIGVVAEGVESRNQVRLLQDAGCDVAQGFLFAKPMSGSRVANFIRTWDPALLRRTVGQTIEGPASWARSRASG